MTLLSDSLNMILKNGELSILLKRISWKYGNNPKLNNTLCFAYSERVGCVTVTKHGLEQFIHIKARSAEKL